jgi:integrase/recombinase XerD
LPKFSAEQMPTLPLTEKEFEHLLASVPKALPDAQAELKRVRARSLFLLMRYSGLSIMDAGCLPKSEIEDTGAGYHRLVTQRNKTGSDVSVPIPSDVALEIIATPNDNDKFIMWSGDGRKKHHASKLSERLVKPCFVAAGLYAEDATMVSHRLRDTFACDLLSKGVPLEEVSKLLGHKSIKTTERHYSAWVKVRQDRAEALVVATWKKTTKAA